MNIHVKGFEGAAVMAGIRYQGRLDLGLLVSSPQATAAACFTKNSIKAAPVKLALDLFKGSPEVRLKGVLVNSGNANACTGDEGIRRTKLILETLAREMKVGADQVLMSSTGVIGEDIPHQRIIHAIPALLKGLSPQGLTQVAQAILTTDTEEKVSQEVISIGAKDVALFGIAKGAGMIAPDMAPPHATMLAFILTDAHIRGHVLQACLDEAVAQSFNRITVDGDMSTNDTVLLLANGASGAPPIDNISGPLVDAFRQALCALCSDLAQKIVKDGEGATKFVKVVVKGARDTDHAKTICQAITHSPLVKTAFYGEDPNWGRIVAAAGKTMLPMNEEKISLWIGDSLLVERGRHRGKDAERAAHAAMKERRFNVVLDLGMGQGRFSMMTTDLSKEYIAINADYRS